MENSILTASQTKSFKKVINKKHITVQLRYDDQCNNGHNTFSITGETADMVGSIHKEISRYFPEFRKYIKWHSCNSDGPLHYIANTLYHSNKISIHQNKWYFYLENKLIRIVNEEEKHELIKKYGDNAIFDEYFNPMSKESDLEAARQTAIWKDATLEQLQNKELLLARLPELMKEFKSDMEELGFVY